MFNKESIKSLVKGKKSLWDFVFPKKVYGRQAVLGGLGSSAVAIKLTPSKNYPNLQFKGFLNWEDQAKWSPEEKELVQALFEELDSSSS